MSKVSKLLLTIENGAVHKFAGRKLSDITLDDCFQLDSIKERDNVGDDDDNDDQDQCTESQIDLVTETERSVTPDSNKDKKLETERRVAYRKNIIGSEKKATCKGKKIWDLEIKEKARLHFRHFINSSKVPGKAECERFIEITGIEDRGLRDIKYLVYNMSKMK